MNLKGKNLGMRGSEKTAPSYSYGKSNLKDIRTFTGKNSIQNSQDFAKKLRSEGKKVTIIGDERGHTVGTYPNKKRPSSLGVDKTKGLDPKFSSRVRKQNQEGKAEAANMLKQASDQKLNRPPPNNKGLKKLPRGVRNKMGFKKAGGQIKNRNMGGVIGGGLGSQDVVSYLYDYKS